MSEDKLAVVNEEIVGVEETAFCGVPSDLSTRELVQFADGYYIDPTEIVRNQIDEVKAENVRLRADMEELKRELSLSGRPGPIGPTGPTGSVGKSK